MKEIEAKRKSEQQELKLQQELLKQREAHLVRSPLTTNINSFLK